MRLGHASVSGLPPADGKWSAPVPVSAPPKSSREEILDFVRQGFPTAHVYWGNADGSPIGAPKASSKRGRLATMKGDGALSPVPSVSLSMDRDQAP